MVFTRIKIDNFYMFKDFDINFIVPKKIDNILLEEERYIYGKNLNYKKVNIILGGNASGKTTFGAFLNLLQNMIRGKSVNLAAIIYDKKRIAKAEIEFLIHNHIFRYKVEVKEDNVKEFFKCVKIFETNNYNKLQNKLAKADWIVKMTTGELADFQSQLVNEKITMDNNNIIIKNYLDFGISFNYLLANYEQQTNGKSKKLELIELFLKSIDPSIKKTHKIKVDDEETDNYLIEFNNGEKIIVPDGDPNKIDKGRLSQGTIEALAVADLIATKDQYNLVYLDERLASMHSELANAIVTKLIALTYNFQQLFITSHDENILDLNLPNHSFVFLKREEYIKVINPEKTLNKNDRELRNYYRNDFFESQPNYDEIWNLEVNDIES